MAHTAPPGPTERPFVPGEVPSWSATFGSGVTFGTGVGAPRRRRPPKTESREERENGEDRLGSFSFSSIEDFGSRVVRRLKYQVQEKLGALVASIQDTARNDVAAVHAVFQAAEAAIDSSLQTSVV